MRGRRVGGVVAYLVGLEIGFGVFVSVVVVVLVVSVWVGDMGAAGGGEEW